MWYVNTNKYVVSENFSYWGSLNFADAAFFFKNQYFFALIVPLLKVIV